MRLNYQIAKVEENVPMSSLTSLRIGWKCKICSLSNNCSFFSKVMNLIKIQFILKCLEKGSNILCSDNDYDGVIIKLDRSFNECYFTEEGCIAQAGCSLSQTYEATEEMNFRIRIC